MTHETKQAGYFKGCVSVYNKEDSDLHNSTREGLLVKIVETINSLYKKNEIEKSMDYQ